VRRVRQSILGQVVTATPCPRCGGTGKAIDDPCPSCRGEGRRTEERSWTVHVPAGVDSGTTLRLSGRGAAGPRGGPPGDLYVLVHVREHERFMRQGEELVTVVDVPAPRAALGTTVWVEGIDGEEIELEIPAGTQPGDTVNVRGAGMPSLQRRGRSGDLVAVVNVQIPRRLDRDQRELLEQLAESVRPEQLEADESLVGKLRRLLS
jgi:molecular chaperone DnaJ